MDIYRRQFGLSILEYGVVLTVLSVACIFIVPQYSMASNLPKRQQFCHNLQSIQSQVRLMYLHHPVLKEANRFEAHRFYQMMTSVTGQSLSVWGSFQDDGTPFGPYFEEVPKNPYVIASNPLFAFSHQKNIKAHWIVDLKTGQVTSGIDIKDTEETTTY